MLPHNKRTYDTTSRSKTIATRTSNFRATFFTYCIEEWDQLNDDFKKIESIKKFKKTLIKVIKTKKTLFMEFIIFILLQLLTPLTLS